MIRRRWSGGGLVLLGALALLLLAPLLNLGGGDHPLASSEHIEVCARLPAAGLPGVDGLARRAGPDRCDLLDADGAEVASIGASSLRSIANGQRADTREVYATWLKEVRASGATGVAEVPGPWRMATLYRLGDRSQLLFEDDGVLVVIGSTRLDGDALRRLAPAVAGALRTQDPTSSR